MSKISRICGIEVKGRIFSELTTLQLLRYENKGALNSSRVSLIYGENGSGKTTISRACLQASGREQGLEKACFVDKNGLEIDLAGENKNVHVFNEDYINSNIRVKEDGLNSIIILGEQKQVDDELNEVIQKEKKPVEKALQQHKKRLEKMNDPNNINSPLFYSKKIEQALRGDNNWAGRGRKIIEQKNNVRVTQARWKEIVTLRPTATTEQLRKRFDNDLETLNNIRKNSSSNNIQKIPMELFDKIQQQVDDVQGLLKSKVEEPLLEGKEKAMEAAIKSTVKEQDLHKTMDYFSEKDNHYCPFCLQSVSTEYIDELITNIKVFLNDAVKKHEEELSASKIHLLELDISNYEKINPLLTKDCKEKLRLLNSEIEKINNFIDEKIRRPFVPLILNVESFKLKLLRLREKINKINTYVDKIKEQSAKITELKNHLFEVNDQIAYFEIIDYYNEYQKELIEKQCLESKKNKEEDKLQRLNRKIDELEERKKSIVIAVSEINDALQYIFFSKDRLSIKAQNNNYILYSRGEPVLPENVSVGERNAIALCYFFTSLLKGKNYNEAYNEPYVIVIDDPVSSFDMENKVGVISYIRYELEKFLQNGETKVVVLTHDLQVFFDIEKVFSELLPNMKKTSILIYCLRNNKLEKYRTYNEYSLMLKDIYNYANGNNKTETVVGNEMRRVLEAFATFLYREGIESISTNKEILECIPENERAYFKNRMYRLVLHGESHSKEKIQTIDDLNFTQFISATEKRKTAQDIVCLMYSLNRAHLHAHLCNDENADNWEEVQSVIESWRQEREFENSDLIND